MKTREELLKRVTLSSPHVREKYCLGIDVDKEALVYNLLQTAEYDVNLACIYACQTRFRCGRPKLAKIINEANDEFISLIEKSEIPYLLEEIVKQQDREFKPQYIDTRNRVSEEQERELDKDTKEQRMDDGEEGL